ncbi:MAG: 30S ribosomal protein S17 [Planctomycetes bacterium]|nr:30S ribosomal protein S17 [Planctomycetota bacterium]
MADEAKTGELAKVTRIGVVVSDKRHKTITIEVRRLFKHEAYGKYIYRSTKLHAHDEKNEAKQGDRVEVEFTRPLSKQKRWRLIKVLERAVDLAAVPGTEAAKV